MSGVAAQGPRALDVQPGTVAVQQAPNDAAGWVLQGSWCLLLFRMPHREAKGFQNAVAGR